MIITVKATSIDDIKRRQGETTSLSVEWNDTRIPIPYFSYIEHLEQRIERLEKEIEKIRPPVKHINDMEAESEITNFILKEKKNGVEKISILDIIENLSLPPEQICRIMDKLQKKGLKEIV